ncbi:MAG: radical SAM protein [Candidatus Paceibacterota bacterium]|jgi:uncharacterized protein
MEHIQAAIVKIGGNMCNLKCSYCFYNPLDQQKKTIMSDDTLERLIQQYLSINQGHFSFIWHGGEPLLLGIEYFDKIIYYQKKYRNPKQRIKNSLQTNGTLINDDWIEFFQKYNFGVGISLDGNQECHDRQRFYRGGKGSFNDVINAIHLMQAHNFKFGIIQVLTKENLPYCKEIFDFFTKELDLKRWCINQMCYIENGQLAKESVTNDEYYSYIKETIDLWLECNNESLSVREIDNMMSGVYKVRPNNCNYNGTCGNYICADYNGDVYPCDRFSSNHDLCFGNINQMDLLDIVHSKTRKNFISAIRKINDDCAECEYFMFCHNGCPHHRIKDISGKYVYCQARKQIYECLSGIHKTFRKEVKNGK